MSSPHTAMVNGMSDAWSFCVWRHVLIALRTSQAAPRFGKNVIRSADDRRQRMHAMPWPAHSAMNGWVTEQAIWPWCRRTNSLPDGIHASCNWIDSIIVRTSLKCGFGVSNAVLQKRLQIVFTKCWPETFACYLPCKGDIKCACNWRPRQSTFRSSTRLQFQSVTPVPPTFH